MTLNRGMLGDLFGAPSARTPEDVADEQLHQFQAQDPFRAMAHTVYSGGTLAGKGLGRVAASAMGADPRTGGERDAARRQAAAEALRAAVQGLKPGTDEYFAAVTKVLNEHGLADQAMAVQQAWEESKLKRAQAGAYDRQHQPQPPKPLRGKEFLLGKYDEITTKLAEDPENPQLQGALKNVKTALETFYPEKKPTEKAGEWKIVPPTATSPGYKYHTGTGDTEQLEGRIEPSAAQKPLTAAQQQKEADAKHKMKVGYDSAAIKAQADYDAAVALYNHPKLDEAVGAVNSAMSDQPPAERSIWTRLLMWSKSNEGLNANALVQTVKAGAFLSGFQEIKQASQAAGAQGAGFGALSDAEGARIAAAKGALDAAQGAPQFRRELKKYIDQMVASWKSLSAGAADVGIQPKPLVEKPLTGGARVRPGAPAPQPKVAPAAPADSNRVRVKAPNGVIGTIPRSQLEAAKAQGYTEVQ